MNLSKHPFDWFCHFTLCFLYTFSGLIFIQGNGWFIVLTVTVVAFYVEYIQKFQVWYNNLTWEKYFWKHSLGDLIADGIGIIGALIIRGIT